MTCFENPFYILDAKITSSRKEIAALCENKSLFEDSDACEEARIILTTPTKRLEAEMHWFPDCSDDDIENIIDFVSITGNGYDEPLEVSAGTSPLSQLNAYLSSFAGKKRMKIPELKSEILRISRLFESLNADEIKNTLNAKRAESGFPQIERTSDIEAAIASLRREISSIITTKLHALNSADYISLITKLSESYSTKRSKGQAVLEDVISDYELSINDALEKKAESIARFSGYISKSADEIDVDAATRDLLTALYAWDRIAQPLQLTSLAKGNSHEASENMFQKMRGLSLKLHNEYSLTEKSLDINTAMIKVFQEMPECKTKLEEDERILKGIIDDKKTVSLFDFLIKEVKDKSETIKNYNGNVPENLVTNLINALIDANSQISSSNDESSDDVRTIICYAARDAAIALSNDKDQDTLALQIIRTLIRLFGNISELNGELRDDEKALLELIEQRKKLASITQGTEKIDALLNSITSSTTPNFRIRPIQDLINEIRNLDLLIKSIVPSDDQLSIRENIGMKVRSSAIDLNNDKDDPENALVIINELKKIFSDVPQLLKRLQEDTILLQNNISAKNANKAYAQNSTSYTPPSHSNTSKKSSSSGTPHRLIVFLIIAAAAIGIFFAKSTSPSSSYSRGTSGTATKPKTSVSTPKSAYSTPKPSPSKKSTPTPTPRAVNAYRPSNGQVFYCKYGDTPCELDITNNFDNDLYCKLVDKTGTDVVIFYVRANSTAKIDVPVGTLELRFAEGYTWYGEQKLFGSGTVYSRDSEPYVFSYGTIWEVTYYSKVTSGYGSSDIDKISASEF